MLSVYVFLTFGGQEKAVEGDVWEFVFLHVRCDSYHIKIPVIPEVPVKV